MTGDIKPELLRSLPFPEIPLVVEACGIALFALWDDQHVPSHALPKLPPEMWGNHTRVDLWPATSLAWKPAHDGENAPWLQEREVYEAFVTMSQLLRDISNDNLSRVVKQEEVFRLTSLFSGLSSLFKLQPAALLKSTNGREMQWCPAQPNYVIFVIEKFRTKIPRFYRRHSGTKRRGDIEGNWRQQLIVNAQERVVTNLQNLFGLAEIDPHIGSMPTRFTHYDAKNRRQGWIVFGSKCALVAGVSQEEASVLASQIHPNDTDRSGKGQGILPEHYEQVRWRIGLWNATQDIAKSVRQLEELVESGKKSADGQVLLNFALAAIGALLALIAFHNLNRWQISALGLIVGASVLFWIYARSGYIRWLIVGVLVISMAIFLAVVSFW